ncbi:AraC family transcriptional regulator [Sphingomonas sp. SUN039]|uniref:AraC family transcriptional regulator n=1 Tax=Sphingomonas sp. SUN039 TaxID=2937787 RepID=UPI002164649D|nr:AraC family transcriptional regulator [Sphingomonas sp. SUN039]UVO54739.1 AraC family transcriptional regulator [Sphingomonas sp. SUN039]
MAEVVRVAALTGYFDAMAALGVDPRPLLAEQGLTADLLINPEQLIPARATIRLLERSAQATGCVTLGLRMVEARALADLGATSLLIAHQPTLRAALATLAEFRARINSTLILHLEEADGQAILREDFALRQPEPSRQSSNLALGVLARLCGSALADSWSPLTVCFAHEAPPAAELAIFTRVFRCRPEFDCEMNGIVLDARDLDRPNVKADDQLAQHARRLLESVMSPTARTITQDVEQLITLLLPSGKATVQMCAASLGVTVRTLQRSLDAEQISFTNLLQRARMQLATQYLANPRMRVTDVAELLGYGSIGAFTRWHTKSFGEPPLRWRNGKRALT